MKKNAPLILISTLASVCALGGYMVGRLNAPHPGEVEVIEIPAPTVTNNTGDEIAKMARLARQLAEAEDTIATLNEQIDHLLGEDLPELTQTDETPAPETATRQERPPRESWEDRMERMKTENPEDYAEMMARREERERRRQEFLEERRRSEEQRDNFFANVNIAHMSPKEQQELAAFVGDYQELRTLFEQRRQGERPDMRQAAELGMRVMAKSNEIRLSLLKATAKEMGFNADESGEFATTINDIFGATSLMGPGGAAGMGRFNRGGRR